MDPSDKTHPKFENVENLHVTMFPGTYQMSGKPAMNLTLKEAYETVSVVWRLSFDYNFEKLFSKVFQIHIIILGTISISVWRNGIFQSCGQILLI